MNGKLRYAFLLSVVAFLGCNRNDYAPSAVKTPQQFPSKSSEYHETINLPDDAWWTKLHDTELNRLVELGLKNNLDLLIAVNHLEEAKGQLQQIKLSWLPSLDTLAGYSTNPALGSPGAFLGVWPIYAINIAQQVYKQKQAKYNVEYYRAMIDGIRLTVIGQIITAYFSLIAQQEQLRLFNQLNKDLKQLLQICHEDIHTGLRNTIDLQKILVEKKNVNAQLSVVKHNIVVSKNALRFLINENPGEINHTSHFQRFDFNQFKPGSLPVAVLQNRPDVKMASLAVQRSGTEISTAYSDFFPLLQLDEFLGGANTPYPMFVQVTDAYPIWNISLSNIGDINAKKGAYKAQVNAYIKTVRTVLEEVDNAFSANKRYAQYFKETEASEEAYHHKYELQQGLFSSGLISYNVWLKSKIELDRLALSTNQAKLQLAISLVMLYQDLATGYAAKEMLFDDRSDARAASV